MTCCTTARCTFSHRASRTAHRAHFQSVLNPAKRLCCNVEPFTACCRSPCILPAAEASFTLSTPADEREKKRLIFSPTSVRYVVRTGSARIGGTSNVWRRGSQNICICVGAGSGSGFVLRSGLSIIRRGRWRIFWALNDKCSTTLQPKK